MSDDALGAAAVRAANRATSSSIEADVLALYDQWPKLQGLAAAMLGDTAAAQDVVSEVLENILRRRRPFPDRAAALAYARAAVVNRARSALRKRAVSQRFLRRSRETAAPSADEAVMLADEYRAVLTQFDRLPTRQREVLTLRYVAELPDSEIARTLKISIVTVRSNASRGLSTLSRLIRENFYDQ